MSFANTDLTLSRSAGWASLACTLIICTTAFADPLGYAGAIFHPTISADPSLSARLAAIEPKGETETSSHFRRSVVDYPTRNAPGTIVIDTPNTYLYFVLNGRKAVRYGIGVGRRGFAWSGVTSVERKAEWPDWVPPAEMLKRQPYLPRVVAGGPGNPLGARALYLSGTLFRIHGTNDPSTIGKRISSGCIRMLNNDVIDLYERAKIGTKVVVLPIHSAHTLGSARHDRPVSRSSSIADASTLRPHGLY